jgi:hypothetical protein
LYLTTPGLERFFFWKDSEKGGLRLRAQKPPQLPNFLGEFFFSKNFQPAAQASFTPDPRDVAGW